MWKRNQADAGAQERGCFLAQNPEADPPREKPQLELYLDRFCAPLVRTVPAEPLRELRAEVRCHLEALVDAHVELGASRDEAVEAALRQFGKPQTIGRQWARQWRRHEPSLPFLGFSAAFCATVAFSFGMMGVDGLRSAFDLTLLHAALAGPVVPMLTGYLWGKRSNLPAHQPLSLLALISVSISLVMYEAPYPDYAVSLFVSQMLAQLLLWLLTALGTAGLTRTADLLKRRLRGRAARA